MFRARRFKNMSAFQISLGLILRIQLVLAIENNFYPSIFSNEAPFDDDNCVIVINEQPCIKNVLKFLGEKIIKLESELRKQQEQYTKESSAHFQKINILENSFKSCRRDINNFKTWLLPKSNKKLDEEFTDFKHGEKRDKRHTDPEYKYFNSPHNNLLNETTQTIQDIEREFVMQKDKSSKVRVRCDNIMHAKYFLNEPINIPKCKY